MKQQFDYNRQAERIVFHVMAESGRIQLKLTTGDKEGADALYKACVHSLEARLRELKDEI